MARRLEWEKANRNENAKATPRKPGGYIDATEEAHLQAWWDAKAQKPPSAKPDDEGRPKRKKPQKPYPKRVADAQARAARRLARLTEAVRQAGGRDREQAEQRLAQFKASIAKKSARSATRLKKHAKRRLGVVAPRQR